MAAKLHAIMFPGGGSPAPRNGGAWRLTIGGVDRTPYVDAISISAPLNDRARATLVLGDLMPNRFEEVISYGPDGITPWFGGLILQRNYQGRNPYDPTYQLTLECSDWFTYADWCYTNAAYPAVVSLRVVLADLVTDHLAQYGVTLDPGQVEGPTLAPFTWVNKRVSDALRELSERTAYVVRFTPDKRLVMFLPGTLAAPVMMTEAAPNAQEITWRDSDRVPYNRVIVACGPGGPAEVADERHYGDGAIRIWELHAPFLQIVGALSRSDMEGGWPVGIYGVDVDPSTGGEYPYSYDPAINSIRQRADQPVVPAGEYVWLWYVAQFPFTVTAETGATPVVEHAEARPDVISRPVGQEIADMLLAQAQAAPREAVITTDAEGFIPGQALTVDLPTTRKIAGAFVITSVALQILLDTTDGDRYWQSTLEAIEATEYQGSYLDGWRKIAGVGSGTTTISGTPPPTTGGGEAGPASPIFLGGSRQFALEPSPAAWLPVVDYVPFVAASAFAGLVRAEVSARRAGVSVSTRLYNVTDGVATAAGPVITATTSTEITFAATIAAGKKYRLELLSSAAGEGVFGIGSLEVA